MKIMRRAHQRRTKYKVIYIRRHPVKIRKAAGEQYIEVSPNVFKKKPRNPNKSPFSIRQMESAYHKQGNDINVLLSGLEGGTKRAIPNIKNISDRIIMEESKPLVSINPEVPLKDVKVSDIEIRGKKISDMGAEERKEAIESLPSETRANLRIAMKFKQAADEAELEKGTYMGTKQPRFIRRKDTFVK